MNVQVYTMWIIIILQSPLILFITLSDFTVKLSKVTFVSSILNKDSFIFIKWSFMTNLPNNQVSIIYMLGRKMVFLYKLLELGGNKFIQAID